MAVQEVKTGIRIHKFAAPLQAIDEISLEKCGGRLTLRATKAVKATDPYMSAHFPGFMIFPGVFIIEALRQAVALALGEVEGTLPEVLTLQSVRFMAPVLPSESLTLEATIHPMLENKSFAVEAFCKRSDGVTAARLKARFILGGTRAA